jgi:hypothetical protein
LRLGHQLNEREPIAFCLDQRVPGRVHNGGTQHHQEDFDLHRVIYLQWHVGRKY